MAYRKTEKVLAQIEAKRLSIVASAIDVIAKSGLEGMTSAAVAERAEIAVGLVFHYFPDMVELRAAVIQHVLDRDRAAIRDAAADADDATDAFTAGVQAWIERIVKDYRFMGVLGYQEGYREGIRAELSKLIRPLGLEAGSVAISAVYGAVMEAGRYWRPSHGPALSAAILRAVGLKETVS